MSSIIDCRDCAFVGVAALVVGVAMLLRDKPANRIEDRLDLLTGTSTPAAKEALVKEASILAQPLDDSPASSSVLSNGSATSTCCSSRPIRR